MKKKKTKHAPMETTGPSCCKYKNPNKINVNFINFLLNYVK